jgi:hypothetical protein
MAPWDMERLTEAQFDTFVEVLEVITSQNEPEGGASSG